MSRPKNTIAEQLNAAHLAIVNSLADPDIQAAVAAHGYPPEKLAEGRKLLDAALVAVSAQTAASGAQLTATVDMEAAHRAAKEAYQDLAKTVRAVYGSDKGKLGTLGLNGKMPVDTDEFIAAANQLFDNAVRLPALRDYGYEASALADGRAKIAAFGLANDHQESAKGIAQQATLAQNDALDCINDWTARYLKIARVALRDKEQLLESLGVLARTSKTAAQRLAAANRTAKAKAPTAG